MAEEEECISVHIHHIKLPACMFPYKVGLPIHCEVYVVEVHTQQDEVLGSEVVQPEIREGGGKKRNAAH